MTQRKKSALVRMLWVWMAALAAAVFAHSILTEGPELDEFILEKMKADNAPGLAACIVKKDRQPLRTGEHFALCLYSFPNYPDGLVRTSVRELSQFLRAYINDGSYENKKILKRETIQTMLSDEHFGRGLCWSALKLKNGDTAWGHGGGDPGISTQMLFRPKDGVGVIIFFNFDRPGKAFGEILERLFEEAEKS